MKHTTKLFICAAVLLLSAKHVAAYSDSIHWWYSNASGTPGTYMINGPGIDETNAGSFQGNPWVGTNFRHGEIIIHRDLQTGINTTYMGGTAVKSVYLEYNPGKEETLNLRLVSTYTAGTTTLMSTSIRYLQDGSWTDWADVGFSGTLPYHQPPPSTESVQLATTYDLATDMSYDAYDIKFVINVPSSVYNKQYLFAVYSIDDPEINHDPLSNPVPEPASIILIGSGIMALIRRFWTNETA